MSSSNSPITFSQHTIESAPEASKAILEGAKNSLGFIPNLYATFAESPAALHAYTQMWAMLEQHAALSEIERNVVAIAISRENDCAYCVAAHTALAKMVRAPEQAVQAVRDGQSISDPKLEALRQFAISVTRERGWVSGEVIEAFLAAGYERRHVLDVITLAALKTLSNFTNHIAGTPLDRQFSPVKWQKAA